MFVSDYNQLAINFVSTFDFQQAPPITVIAGDEGLGKSTLLHYLFIKCQHHVLPTMMIEAKKFSSKYCYAAHQGDLSNFRRQFRSARLLMIDDIQALKGKKKTIEELLHTVDAILTRGGKLVITLEGKESDLQYLGERLASRFRSGLMIRINQPTRQEIENFIRYYLQSEQREQVYLPETGVTNLKQAVRMLDRQEPDPEEKPTQEMVGSVANLVAAHLGVAVKKILGPEKSRNVVLARYMMFLLLHEKYHFSFASIAKFFNRNPRLLEAKCLEVKLSNSALFETLCQKMYNNK